MTDEEAKGGIFGLWGNWISTLTGLGALGAAGVGLWLQIANRLEDARTQIGSLKTQVEGDERTNRESSQQHEKTEDAIHLNHDRDIASLWRLVEEIDHQKNINTAAIEGIRSDLANLKGGETTGAKETAAALQKQIDAIKANQDIFTAERMRIVDEIERRLDLDDHEILGHKHGRGGR